MKTKNEIKLLGIFSETLRLPLDKITDNLTYNGIAEWDSIGHMVLVTAIESAFDVMLDTNDIIDMSSFRKAKEILNKYEIAF